MLAVRRFAGDYLVDCARKGRRRQACGTRRVEHPDPGAGRPRLGWIILGLVTLVGVWFVGTRPRAAQARHAAAPVLRNRATTYGIAAAALLGVVLVAAALARRLAVAAPADRPCRRGDRARPSSRPPRSYHPRLEEATLSERPRVRARISSSRQHVRRTHHVRREGPGHEIPADHAIAPARRRRTSSSSSDDVGFGPSSAFGGAPPTPNAERLAAEGLKYNRFHHGPARPRRRC